MSDNISETLYELTPPLKVELLLFVGFAESK